MARRRYETLEDRQREDMVMHRISRSFGWRYRRSEKNSSYDGELADCRDGIRVMALIEIKCRYTQRNDHAELIVTKKKIDAGVKLAEARGVEYILGVRWMDVTAWMRISSERAKALTVETAGRTDRNDIKDREPCYMIPVDGFTILAA